MKQCKQCTAGFEITEADRAVLQRFSAPEPSLCPDCRMQRRAAFRGEMNFHKTTCAITGKSILTNISFGQGYKILAYDMWYSDQWDPLAYGRDFDFSRPFFEQFQELSREVPHINLLMTNSDNCEYCNYAVNGKNCYLCTRVGDSEQAYYSYLPINSFRIFDSYYVQKSQECYEAVDCADCYRVFFSQRLKGCRDTLFSLDCVGCEHCFGCVGLRYKQYHLFNKPLSKEAYFEALKNLNLGSYSFIQKIRDQFYHEEVLKRPMRSSVIENSENVLGNYIYDSRNVHDGFDISDAEDVRYSWGVQKGKDNYDTYASYLSHETYNTVGPAACRQILYSYATYSGCFDLQYCMECANTTQHCFGSIGLKHKEYCIFNKQYTQGDYEKLKAKIIEHMKRTGEYGEFFPMPLSLVAYNESVAQEYFPITREAAKTKGLFWFEESKSQGVKNYAIPDHIRDVEDAILDAVLICEKTGRPYKIIPQELKFYRENNIPIPRVCPYERHVGRIRQRAPRRLWDRACAQCQSPLQTPYGPDRPEKVVCEACYLKAVY